ncbi:DUF2264 domain-containing protein [Kribbella sp. NPDC055071]
MGLSDRQSLVDRADLMLLAMRPYASPGHARFDLPGPPSASGRESDGLEAYARSLLAMGFRLSAASEDPHDHAGWYAAGLIAGTDPDSPERWPSLADRPQARVETAILVIGLFESRRWLWDSLSDRARHTVIDWLAPSATVWYADNNWRWFANVTQAFLRSVGGPYDPVVIDRNLDFLETCYLGDGWYSDGRLDSRGGNVDWYVGWVMHLFSLWYCRMSPGVDGELLTRYQSRLRDYVDDVRWLVGADGAPLYQGRSLVYRFATVGAIWADQIFDVNALDPGECRRIGLGTVNHFVDAGSFESGLLRLGWHRQFLPMRQHYSGPGSPYWASLGLAGLVLGDDHPLWTAPDVPDRLEGTRVIAPIGWVVSRTLDDGIVRVANHGVDHSGVRPSEEDANYCRLAYSTVTAPAVAHGPTVDNLVALVDPSGRRSERRPIELIETGKASATSRHQATFVRADEAFDYGPWITCTSILHNAVEVRLVTVGPSDEPYRLVISGYATPAGSELDTSVVGLHGSFEQESTALSLSNAFGEELGVNWVRTAAPVTAGEVYAAAVVLAGYPAPVPSLVVGPDDVVIDWQDGTFDTIPTPRSTPTPR